MDTDSAENDDAVAVTSSTNENTNDPDGVFITAGFIAIEVEDESGNRAVSSDQPIEVTMEVAEETINPDTNEPVQEGDVIPLWGYNPQTGEWTYGGETTVTLDENEGFSTNFESNQFTYYNLDWFSPGFCRYSGVIRVEGNDNKSYLVAKVYRQNSLMHLVNIGQDNNNQIKFIYVSRNIPVRIDFYFEKSIVGSLEVEDLCSMDETVVVTMPDTIDIAVQAAASCYGIEYEFNVPLYYRLYPGGDWRVGWIKSGENNYNGIIPNSDYEVTMKIQGEWRTTILNSGDESSLDYHWQFNEETCAVLN